MYNRQKAFEIPYSQIESIATAYDAAVSEVEEKIYFKNEQAYAAKVRAVEVLYEELNPEAGAYEGNGSDDLVSESFEPSWDQLNKAVAIKMTAYIKTLGLASKAKWLLPMLDNHIHKNMQLYSVVGSVNPKNGKPYIDGTRTARKFAEISEFNRGLLLLYTHTSRSAFLQSQTSPDARNYSTMVPLVLAVFKRFGFGKADSVEYSSWSREHLSEIVAPNLLEMMLSDTPEVTEEDIYTSRDFLFGETKPVATTFAMYGKGQTPFADCGQLLVHSILQSWVCHPSHRTKYMILDCEDWDNIPDSLVSTSIIAEKPSTPCIVKRTKKPVIDPANDIQWD